MPLNDIHCLSLTMANFQVEHILGQLKELRQEKSKNEQLFKVLQQERRNLEKNVEAAVLQYGLAKDVREREMDHLKVAERKLEGLQDQLRVAEEANKVGRDRVTALNNQLDCMVDDWDQECKGVEEELSTLSTKLRTAKQLYEKDHVVEEMKRIEVEKASLQSKVSALGLELEDLTNDFEALKIQSLDKRDVHTAYGVPVLVWMSVKDVIGREHKELLDALEDVRKQIKGTEERFRELEESLIGRERAEE